MPKRKKNPTDPILLAREVVEAAIGELLIKPPKGKNLAAVALGHLGGLKGGPARAKKLSAKKRIQIARKAARIRWTKKST